MGVNEDNLHLTLVPYTMGKLWIVVCWLC